MKTIFSIIAMLMLSIGTIQAQGASTKKAKFATVEIKTSANCDDCKGRIETALSKVKGVKTSDLNLETKVVAVNYSPKKTDTAIIRNAISKTGYDADDIVANQEAHDNLPMCCRKGGHD